MRATSSSRSSAGRSSATTPVDHGALTGDELGEFRLPVAGRECSVLYRRALVTWLDEQIYLGQDESKQYGVVLWPASIALALEISERAVEFRGRRVLELGAGVGLPGIAAAAVGADVVQTDRDESALALSRENAERNGVAIESRALDWAAWSETGRYDWVIASDILYRASLHEQLRGIFESVSAAGGRLLVADPIRASSLRFLQALETDGWTVGMNQWAIGEGEDRRTIGVFDLRRVQS